MDTIINLIKHNIVIKKNIVTLNYSLVTQKIIYAYGFLSVNLFLNSFMDSKRTVFEILLYNIGSTTGRKILLQEKPRA